MRTYFIVLIALVLCSFAAAQRLEFDGENFGANRDMKHMAKNIGFQFLEDKFGISVGAVKAHAGLLVAGVLHYFFENINIGSFRGEDLISMFVA